MIRILTIPGLVLALSLAGAALAEDAPPAAQQAGPGMMMQGGPMMMGPMGPMGMMAVYPDGYAAFLKTELGITPAQEDVWQRFAKVIKERAAALQAKGGWHRGPAMMRGGGGGPGMMGPGMMGQTAASQSLPQSLDRHVEWAEARLESLKALRKAAKPLYDALSPEQKTKADQLLGCPMCML